MMPVGIPSSGPSSKRRAMIGQPREPAERAQRCRAAAALPARHRAAAASGGGLQRDVARRAAACGASVARSSRAGRRVVVQRHQRLSSSAGQGCSGSTGSASTRMRPRQPEPEPNTQVVVGARVEHGVARLAGGQSPRGPSVDEPRLEATARDHADLDAVVRHERQRPGLAIGRAFGLHHQRQREGAAGGAQPAAPPRPPHAGRRVRRRASGAELERQLTQPLVRSARPRRWRRRARSAACPARRRRPASRVLGTMCTSTSGISGRRSTR